MKKTLLFLALIVGNFLWAQVGVGTDLPSPSAQLDIKSSNRGVLIPQIALTSDTDQTTISAGNVESLLVYNTSTTSTLTPGYYYWFQGRWQKLAVEANLPDHTVYWDVVNNAFTYIDASGNIQAITINSTDKLTYLGLSSDGSTLEYTDENDTVTGIDLAQVVKNFETLTTVVTNTDGTFTFTDEAGNPTIIDISNLETLTTIALNADNTNIDYTDEAGVVTQLNLTTLVRNLETITTVVDNTDGTFTFTDEAGNPTIIDISNLETLTTIALNADNTNIDYTDEAGNTTQLNLTALVQNLETLTTVVANTDGTFTFTDEAGNPTIIDISSLETLTTIALNADNTNIDYTDEAGVVTQLNLSALVRNLETTTTLVDGTNTTVGSTTNLNNTEYQINVSTATGTTLGVVREAALNPTVKINAQGELSVDYTNLNTIVETSVAYTVQPNDAIVLGNANGGDVNITLPAATADNRGKKIIIKKEDSNEDFFVTINGTIDGLSQLYTALPYSGWELISDGTEWKIINKF